MANFKLRICKLFKDITFELTRFPIINFDGEVKQHRDETTSPQDIKEYQKCSTGRSKTFVQFILFTYFALSLKNIIAPIKTYSLYDYGRPETSLKIRRPSSPQPTTDNCCGWTAVEEYEFSCLATNCSSLVEGHHLLEDLVKLDLFGLCYPRLQLFYSPCSKLGIVTIFLFSFSSFGAVCLGCLPIFYQLILKATNRTIFFIAAPELSRKMLKFSTRRLLHDLYSSLDCFEEQTSFIDYSQTKKNFEPQILYRLKQSKVKFLISSNDWQRKQHIESMIEDCLPLSRSHWWRSQLVSLLAYSLFISLASIYSLVLVVLAVLEHIKTSTQHLYGEYQLEMSKKNCSIWSTDMGASSRNSRIRLDEIDFHWTPVMVLETIVIYICPLFPTTMLLAYIYAAFREAAVWLTEIRTYLKVSVIFMRFDNYHAGNNMDVRDDIFRINCIKRAIEQTIVINYGVLLTFQFDSLLGSKDFEEYRQQLWHRNICRATMDDALDVNKRLMSKHLSPDDGKGKNFSSSTTKTTTESKATAQTNEDNLEKVYIQFRLFMDHVRSLSQLIELLLTVTYVINYGSLILCAICIRNIRGFLTVPLVTLIVTFLLSNGLMLLTSDFHARASKCLPSIWSLIAQMSPSKSRRVQHLRSLWVRQAEHLDYGIGLVAFGIRITYVNNIQLIIGTLTVLLVVLRPPQ